MSTIELRVPTRPGQPLGVAVAIDAVAALTGIERAEIVGSGRDKRVIRARWLAALVARRYLGRSTVAIGTALRRDYSTIVHGLQRAIAYEQSDPTFARDVAVLSRAVEEAAALIGAAGLAHDCADVDAVAVAVRVLRWRGTTTVSENEIVALARAVLAMKDTPAALEAAATVVAERDAMRAAARRVLDAARRWSEATGYDGLRIAERHFRDELTALRVQLAAPPTTLPSIDSDEEPT